MGHEMCVMGCPKTGKGEPGVATCVVVGKRCNMCLTAAHTAVNHKLAPELEDFQYAEVYPLSGPQISMPDKAPVDASPTVQQYPSHDVETLSAAMRTNPGIPMAKETNEAMLIVYPKPIKAGPCIQITDFDRNTPPAEGKAIMLAGYPTENQSWDAFSLKVSTGKDLD